VFHFISTPGTVTDIDGNIYQTITIGSQVWMAENLKVTHFQNGDIIPNVTDSSAWSDRLTGAYCNYINDENNANTYGRLYNWHAIDDSRNIAPEGWHVPTDEEWNQLEIFLGMDPGQADEVGMRGGDVGGKLKETGYSHWVNPNEGATNECGFSALPGGLRVDNGHFQGKGFEAFFWTSTERDSDHAWHRFLTYAFSSVMRGNYSKRRGFSVRCVRD